jgi:hypothetical protein
VKIIKENILFSSEYKHSILQNIELCIRERKNVERKRQPHACMYAGETKIEKVEILCNKPSP